ncbi:putative ribonuclease H-like domain-containing protein [Tanacetum coccineum]
MLLLSFPCSNLVSIPVTTTQESGTSTTKMIVPATAEEKTCKKNNVKARNDLYNNFKIIKQKVKKSTTASSGDKDMAFVSASSTSSTKDVNTANPPYEVSTVSSKVNTASSNVSTASICDDTVYAFMITNPHGYDVLHQHLEKIHEDDLEAMDLKWQLSLLSMRAKKYFQRTGKRIFINGNDTAGYDKLKVECFNCHKLGHFARECRNPKSQDNRPKNYNQGSRNQEPTRRTMNVEDTSPKVMLAIDGVGFDWSDMAEEQVQTNMALMAFSDSEVYIDKSCSKTCHKNYETLKKQCDDLLVKLNDTEFKAATYKRGLATVEDQLVTFRKNEALFGEEIIVLKREIDKLLANQITDKSKKGVGYYAVQTPHPLTLNAPTRLDLSYSGLDEFKEPEFNGYGPRDYGLKPTIVCGKESDNSEENTDDSLEKGQVTDNESSSVESPLKVNTVRPRVINTVRHRVVNTARPYNALVNTIRANGFNAGNPQLNDKGFVDSGCSRHMTGNISYLSNFKEFDGVPKENLTCLIAKDTTNESMLWHRRLGHINFKNINKLVKENLVRGLPLKCFKNDQTYVACLKGKQHRASCKTKQNGIAERRNRTLIEAARPMLSDSKLPTTFWAEAVSTACYIVWASLMEKSDEGFFVGYSLSSKAFRVYNTRTRKVEENLHVGFLKNKPMIEGNGPKWLFDIDSLTESMNCIPISTGTTSNESAGTQEDLNIGTLSGQKGTSKDYIVMLIWKDASYFDSSTKDFDNGEPKSVTDEPNQVEDGLNNEFDDKDDDSSFKEDNTGGQQLNTASLGVSTGSPELNTACPRVSTRSLEVNTVDPPVNTASPTDMLKDNHTLEVTHIEFVSDKDEPEVELGNIPNSYAVPTTPHTRIHKDHPFVNVIVDLPKGKRPIGVKWTLKNKTDERGIVVRNKARLVTQGYTQEEGIDYDDVFSPVARIEAIRLFLAYASFIGFMVYQMDVKSAFLYGTIEEEVYVCQPPEFEDPDFPDKV